jgi:hypothetical protein
MKKITLFTLILLVALALLSGIPALAQTSNAGLTLRLAKVVGYASLSASEIQGTFTLTASGPGDLARVEFKIDNQTIGEAISSPFRIRFDTGSYSLGMHTLSAVGYTSGGNQLVSNPVQVNFVTAQAGYQAAFRIALPILVVALLAVLLSAVIPAFLNRGKPRPAPGSQRNYGVSGGAICPHCQRPFARHFLSPHVFMKKLERCPYCGKWSLVSAASPDALRAAEAAELEAAQENGQVNGLSEAEKLRKDLDQSKYQDL